MAIYIIVAIILLIGGYIIVCYNNFVKLDNQVDEAFSTMDIYLKKRWDLIPNLVEVVKGYVKHEKTTLEEIVKLRNASYENMNNATKVDVNNKLSQGLNKIMAIAESYPELKASNNFKDLSEQLAKVEDEIANSRKYYNGAVREFNNRVEVFPSNVFANIFGYKAKSMFEASSEERKDVRVEF